MEENRVQNHCQCNVNLLTLNTMTRWSCPAYMSLCLLSHRFLCPITSNSRPQMGGVEEMSSNRVINLNTLTLILTLSVQPKYCSVSYCFCWPPPNKRQLWKTQLCFGGCTVCSARAICNRILWYWLVSVQRNQYLLRHQETLLTRDRYSLFNELQLWKGSMEKQIMRPWGWDWDLDMHKRDFSVDQVQHPPSYQAGTDFVGCLFFAGCFIHGSINVVA